jgi:hypothetical protein
MHIIYSISDKQLAPDIRSEYQLVDHTSTTTNSCVQDGVNICPSQSAFALLVYESAQIKDN